MKQINVLVTAGGTYEFIDPVRVITNLSTGSLGAKVSEQFLKKKSLFSKKGNVRINKIFHISTRFSVIPKGNGIEIENSISTSESLEKKIKEIVKKNKIHIIIHAMAVSDYKPSKKSKEKISSKKEELNINLKKTKKIIEELRPLSKSAVIVGFKLMTKTKKEKLLKTGINLIKNNDLDFCLANDHRKLGEKTHKGYLIDKSFEVKEYEGKDNIAKAICQESIKTFLAR